MTEIHAVGQTLPEAYHRALYSLSAFGDFVPCPAYDTQCLECGLTMVVRDPISEPMISKMFFGGPDDLEQYTEEMLDGILDFKIGHGWDYTYHSRMTGYPCVDENNEPWLEDQVQFVLNELRSDPHSRRAVINIRDVYADAYLGDPACLQHIQYFVRDGKLDCSVLFRSNDALKATFMNAYALIRLQERIAVELGAEMGTYTHRANSFHCYERDWGALWRFQSKYFYNDYDYTYDYKGDWEALMDEEKPKIKEKIEKLKGELNNA